MSRDRLLSDVFRRTQGATTTRRKSGMGAEFAEETFRVPRGDPPRYTLRRTPRVPGNLTVTDAGTGEAVGGWTDEGDSLVLAGVAAGSRLTVGYFYRAEESPVTTGAAEQKRRGNPYAQYGIAPGARG